MSLNNIAKEPRREITEIVIGTIIILLAIASTIYPAYVIADAINPKSKVDFYLFWLVFTMGIAIAYMLVYPILLLMHNIGESTCDTLDKINIHLRPKQRYR